MCFNVSFTSFTVLNILSPALCHWIPSSFSNPPEVFASLVLQPRCDILVLEGSVLSALVLCSSLTHFPLFKANQYQPLNCKSDSGACPTCLLYPCWYKLWFVNDVVCPSDVFLQRSYVALRAVRWAHRHSGMYRCLYVVFSPAKSYLDLLNVLWVCCTRKQHTHTHSLNPWILSGRSLTPSPSELTVW